MYEPNTTLLSWCKSANNACNYSCQNQPMFGRTYIIKTVYVINKAWQRTPKNSFFFEQLCPRKISLFKNELFKNVFRFNIPELICLKIL